MPLLTVRDDRGRFVAAPRASVMMSILNLAFIFLIALPLAVYLAMALVRNQSLDGATVPVAILTAASVLVGLVWPAVERRRALASARELGRCPSCRADLTETTPEDDGCTVCPTCAAAWRIDHDRLVVEPSTPEDDVIQ